MPGHLRANEKAKGAKESEKMWRFEMRDKTVQVKLSNKLSSTAIKSPCIDTNQSMIESLDNMLCYAQLSVAIVLLVYKLWTKLFKTAKHLNSFVLHCNRSTAAVVAHG
jgi:hypothetical protein